MEKTFVQSQSEGVIEAARGIILRGEPGLVVIARPTKSDGNFDGAAVFGRNMPAEQLRSALLTVLIALGRATEGTAKMGTVMTPED